MRDDHRRLAHAGLTFGVPLSEARAGSLVASVGVAPGGHVVELACGWAELLLRVVETHPGTTGVGVDPDRRAVDRGRAAIAKRGLHERVELVEGDPATFQDMGEAVICAGGGQSFGGSTAALRRIRAIVEPGGVVLFGDAYWQRPPGAEARARFGELPVLDGLTSVAAAAGYGVEATQVASEAEWDAFEATRRRGLETADDPDARLLAIDREREYRSSLRGVLGFAWLLLRAPRPGRSR